MYKIPSMFIFTAFQQRFSTIELFGKLSHTAEALMRFNRRGVFTVGIVSLGVLFLGTYFVLTYWMFSEGFRTKENVEHVVELEEIILTREGI